MKDLCVEQIINVYQSRTQKWKRDRFEPRNRDAIVLFIEGEIEYFFSDRSIVAKKGDLLLLPGNVAYRGMVQSKTVAFFVLDFKCTSDDAFLQFGAPCTLIPQDFDALSNGFSEALSAWNQQKTDASFKVKSFLYSTLADIVESDQIVPNHTQASHILTYISEHYTDSDLSVALLCERFYISEAQLRRNIIKATGITTNEYIILLRINRAKQELVCTDKSVKQIAWECGFSSAYYFSRCFHQHTGLSPKAFREQNLML